MRKIFGVLFILFALPMSDLASVGAYPLTLEQREHLKTYLPRTFLKLDNQRSVHIVALGDSVTWMYTRDDNNGNWLLSYLGNFSTHLAREFFFPGGVRALNPEEGHPTKLKDHQGKEIFIENLAIPGRCAIDALQRVSTDAFVNKPDLVVIDFGINDAVRGHSLDSYRQALQRTIETCRANGTDVILMAPSLIRASSGPTGWGLTRPYATVAREVAAKNEVLFVDLGASLAPLGGGIPSGVEPEAAVVTMADRLGRIFEFDPMPETPETLHPNEQAHEIMGRAVFEAVMSVEPRPNPYQLSAQAEIGGNDLVKVKVIVKNGGDSPKSGYLGALAMGRALTPKQPYQSFSMEPGRTAEIEFEYERESSAIAAGGRVALDVADPNLRLSYFVVDEEGSRLMDAVTRLRPLSVEWTQQIFGGLEKDIRYEWRFVNGAAEDTKGRYRIGMGEAVSGWVPFDLPGLGAKKFEATFPFAVPEGATRFKTSVFVEVEVDGKTFVFPRVLEAVRDIGLGQRTSLAAYVGYGDTQNLPRADGDESEPGSGGVVMRVDGDQDFLYFAFDFSDVGFTPVPNAPSLTLDISLDARPIAEVGQFGFVDKVRVYGPAEEGPAEVVRPQLAAFGDGAGNEMVIPSGGIRAELKSSTSAGGRRLEVQLPVAYLLRYDGQVGDPASVLGINASLSFAAIGDDGQATFPNEKRYLHVSPYGGPAQSMYSRDPRCFGKLRLTTGQPQTWSAHLF